MTQPRFQPGTLRISVLSLQAGVVRRVLLGFLIPAKEES
jgi:hypothetical protein